MEKMFSRVMIASSLLAVSTVSLAAPESKGQFGVGISLANDTTIIRAPIDLGEFRIEPEIGLSSTDTDTTLGDIDTIHLGAGAYLQKNVSNEIDLYFGGKAAFESLDLGPADGTGFSVAAIAGFEYFIDKHVSFGGEVGFGIDFGDFSGYGTQSSFVLRYYP